MFTYTPPEIFMLLGLWCVGKKDKRNRKWKRNAAEMITHSIVITSGVITQQIQLICSCILSRMSIERVLKVVCRYDFVRQAVWEHHSPFIKLEWEHWRPFSPPDDFRSILLLCRFPFCQVYILFFHGNKSQKKNGVNRNRIVPLQNEAFQP